MATTPPPGLGDLLSLFGGANPLAGFTKTIGQLQTGVAQFQQTIDTLNSTMLELNGVAKRVNSLLDTVEEPIKAFVPQVTRTIKAADSLVDQLTGPVEKVAPSLNRLADTLATPALAALPANLTEFVTLLNDLARRLQPLGQIAESAGSLFGLRPLAGLRPAARTSPAPPPPSVVSTPQRLAPVKKAPVKKAPAKKAPVKKAAAKNTPVKKSAASKALTKKTAAPKKDAAKR